MKTNRILSLLLALVMLLGLLPVVQLTAKAAETFNPTPAFPADSVEPIILYEENFDSTVGTVTLNAGNNYVGDAAGWVYHQKSDNSAAYIQDGKLYVSGSRYDMLYRDGGQAWGNYILEADFCYTEDCQSSAWGGMMYNFQSTTKWQKVGISLAGSASANGYDGNWTNNSSSLNKLNMKTAGLTVPGLGDPFRMKVAVHNKTADFYYAMLNADGTMKTDWILLKSISNIPADAQTGTIGFMTSSDGKYASYWVDNIKCYSYNNISYTEDFESYGDITLTADADNTDIGVYYDKNHDSSTASIQDGRLYLNGGGTGFDAIFLNMGKNWTNYTLEADMTFTEAYTGWAGLLYRSTDVDNFQKVMLGTNGRVNMNGQLDGSWYKNKENVTLGYADVSATVEIPTRIRVVAEEGTAKMYVAFYDTETGVLGDFTTEPIWQISDTFDDIHMTGTAGVMVGGGSNSKTCSVWVDNIWVSRGSDRMTPAPEAANAADIYEPTSGIVNPPVVVQQLKDVLPAVSGQRPAVVMMEVDENMNVLGAEGTVVTSVSEFIDTYRYVLIPAFIIDSQAEAQSLAQLLQEKNLIDCYVMAEAANASLVRAVRMANTTTSAITGALIFDDLTTETARKNARALVADNMSYVAISRTPLTAADANYFNVRQIAAWSWAENQADVFAAVANGNHGIISTDTAMVYNVYESITETTVSGKPIIIAHRGANNQQGVGYPENTLIGYEAAQEVFGADAIEIDVRLTSDGYVYLMHDGTVDRTTNGTGNGADYTLGELKNLVADEIAGMETTVPTLEELLQKYQGTDLVVYCHINIKTDDNVAAFSHLIEKYGFQDNILFFVSYANRADFNSNTDRTASSTTYGFTDQKVVTDGIVFTSGDTDILSGLSTDVEGIVAMRNGLTAYNYQPLFYKYSNYGAIWGTESFYYQLSARGFVNSHSITNGQDVMDDLALTGAGVTGYLTDSLDKCDDYHYMVEATDELLTVGQGLNLTKQLQMTVGTTETSCGITQLSGPALVETENGYTLTEAGEVTLVYYATRTADGGSTYRVYSQPVTVTFSDEIPAADVAVVNDTYYKTVQAAVDAANGGIVTLLADSQEDITVTGDLYLDLNGYSLQKVTITDGTLYGMDSATNEYAASGAKIGTVDGTYASHYRHVDAKRYLAIAEDDGVSFHRFYMGITKVSLEPAVTGFGYKAEFYGDEAVQAKISSIGYTLWLDGGKEVTRSTTFKNLLTLRLKNYDVAGYGETAVNAKVFVTLTDGTTIESLPTAYSMRQMLELIAATFDSYEVAQKKAVQAMCLAHETTANWDIASILNWKEIVAFFGASAEHTTSAQFDLSQDTGANSGTVNVSENGISLGYVDSFQEENFYFESKIHINSIKSTESYPKFGLFIQDGSIRHHFYVDMNTALTATKVGRMTVTNGNYDWDNINTATISGMAFSGEGEYITMGVLKDGKFLHLFVDGKHALSYESAMTGTAVAGVFGFNTSMTLTEYFADTSAQGMAAKKALVPRYAVTKGNESVMSYDAATDTITIDMDGSSTRNQANLYENGVIVSGERFAVTGHMKVENTPSSGSAAGKIEFQVANGTSNFVKATIYRFNGATSANNSVYINAADAINGRTPMGYSKPNADGTFTITGSSPDNLPAGDPYEADYQVIYENGTVYIALDGVLVYRFEGTFGEMEYLFGVTQYADVTYTNTKVTYDAHEIAKMADPYRLEQNNGISMTTNNASVSEDSGIYTLDATTYEGETVLKDSALLEESCYRVGGTLFNNGTADWAQAQITVKSDDSHAVRFVLERTNNGYYQVFTEKNFNDPNWANWAIIIPPSKQAVNRMNFDVVVIEDTLYLIIDNLIYYSKQYEGIFDKSFVTIGGQNVSMTVSNMNGEIFADVASAQAYVDGKAGYKYISNYKNAINTRYDRYFGDGVTTKTGGTLLLGSSTIDYWGVEKYSGVNSWTAKTGLIDHVNGYNVGIGGTCVEDWLYAYDKLIVPFNASRFVVYIGGNDISVKGATGADTVKELQTLLEKIHTDFPDSEIIYIYTQITPGSFANGVRTKYENAEYVRLCKEYCESQDWIRAIDANHLLTTEDGMNCNPDLFYPDNVHLNETGYGIWGDYLYEQIFQYDVKPFFGSVGNYSTTAHLDLSEDTGANTGTVTVTENGIAFGYIAGFQEENFYFETKIHVNGIKSTESYPKFGLFVRGNDSKRHNFYVDMKTDLTATVVGRMTNTDGKDNWSDINKATLSNLAFSGEGEYITMGVLKDGKCLHLFVDGNYVLTYESEITGKAMAGIFGFNTGMTLTEYYTETSAEALAAKKALIPHYIVTKGSASVMSYDAATDAIIIDMDASNTRNQAQLVYNGVPVLAENFAVTGHIKVENTKSTGSAASQLEFQVAQDTNNFLKMTVYRYGTTNNSVYINTADAGNGSKATGYAYQKADGSFGTQSAKTNNLAAGDPYEVDYKVIFENGVIYLELDGVLVYKFQSTFGASKYYFGVTKYADATYTNTQVTYDAEEIAAMTAAY